MTVNVFVAILFLKHLAGTGFPVKPIDLERAFCLVSVTEHTGRYGMVTFLFSFARSENFINYCVSTVHVPSKGL